MSTISINYTASPTFQRFHADKSFVRGMRGPVGSGKSIGSIIELVHRALQQRPNAAGFRKSRWGLVRATYPELKSTTIKSFADWIPDTICPIRMNDSPINATLTLPLPDKTVVVAEFVFIALDKPKDLGKLLSLELTGAFLNEAKELDKAVLDTVTSRVGRFPSMRDGGPTWSGVIMDTNSPAEDHWYAELEQKPPEGWSFYRQPPALLRDGPGRFKPNPLAENIANLPNGYNYYFNSIGGKDANWIRAYVLNEYATIRDGKPVFGEDFGEATHVAPHNLWPVKNKPVIIGFDFGLTPSAIFGQVVDGQLRILDELVATRLGLTSFLSQAVLPLIAEKYARHERLYVGDPSGVAAKDTDEKSCFKVLAEHNMTCLPASTNLIEPRLEAVRHFLNRMVGKGQPAFLLSPHCTTLRNGFITGYQYDRVQVSGEARFRDVPAKNKFSHCFVAGTPVATPAGERPIETLQAGDFVRTPAGPRVVTATMSSPVCDLVEILLSDGRRLVATPDHPFYTRECGIVRADELQYLSLVDESEKVSRQWLDQQSTPSKFSTESASTRSPAATTRPTTAPTAGFTCTAQCGSTTTARFWKGLLSITKTMTGRITASRIWSFFPTGSTPLSMESCGQGVQRSLLTWPRYALPQACGTLQTRGERGTASTANAHGGGGPLSLVFARTVARLTRCLSARGKKDSAPRPVKEWPVSDQASMTSTASVLSVEPLSAPTSTLSLRRALVVVAVKPLRLPVPVPVYDLTVDDAHCFYANRVLVSNCHDALQYVCLRALTAMRLGAQPKYTVTPTVVADALTGY